MFELSLILGVIMIAISLSICFERAYMLGIVKEVLESKTTLFFASLVNIAFGLLILSITHLVRFDLIGLFAVTGWLMLIRGLALLWFPVEMGGFARKLLKYKDAPSYAAAIHAVWGALLLYLAYGLI